MTDYPSPPNQIEQFAILIFRLNAALLQNGNNIAGRVGQTSARWHILGQLEFHPQTVPMIARNMGQARQSVQRLTNSLVADGLVEYSKHPTDSRTKLVVLTNKGCRIIDEINKHNLAWITCVTPLIKNDELQDTNIKLKQMAELIERNQYQEEK